MKKNENSRLLLPIFVIVIVVIVTIVLLIINREKEYKIIVDGKEYICTSKEKYDASTLGFSKMQYHSIDEAMDVCKQNEIIIYSANGELEEYQEKRTKCDYKNEDDEQYYLSLEGSNNYKNCKEVK